MARPYVFLSYCHDNKKDAQALRRELVNAGIDVWWDDDIEAGQNIKSAIREAMKRASHVVFCVSKETAARSRTGIYPEARDAIEILRSLPPEATFLIPVRFSKADIPAFEIDATTSLSDLRFIDLFPPSARIAGVKQLLKSIKGSKKRTT